MTFSPSSRSSRPDWMRRAASLLLVLGNNVHPLIKPLLPARLLFASTPAARAHCAALPHCSLEEGDDKLHQRCIPLIHARVA